ncbi:MAG: LamG domain-containing protein [Emticicia sp.]|uniref:LamG domain-containing protein n=1 Tax=Emticicia sp. TaxID=1930953 RepID=UPI003BA7006D
MIKLYTTCLLFILSVCAVTAQKTKQAPRRPLPTTNNVNAIIGCSVFSNPQNYTCKPSFAVAAPIDDNSGYTEPAGANWDCYGSRPNQVWFLFTVTSPGTLTFTFNGIDNSSNYYDIDGIIWGPIPNGNFSNACSVTANQPITCDWDSGSADLVVPNAQVGQVYTMLITNYSNEANTIYINQPTGGAVSYCMANLPAGCLTANATISGTQTVQPSQTANLTLSFTGTSPWNYTLSNGTSGIAYSSPLNISVSPTQTTTYTITSLSNSCGSGSASGSATVTVSSSNVNLDSGLITCFPFNGNASDARGGNHATVYGPTLTTDRFNRPNQAYNFDGVDDYMIFPTNNLQNQQFTYSVWVKPDSPPNEHEFIIENTQNIVYSDYTPNKGYGIWNYRTTQTGPATYSQVIPTDLNRWYHVVVTATANTVKLYINGSFVTSTFVGGNPSYSLTTALIGKRFNNTFYFGGKIDDIRVYSRALNDAEVTALYNLPVEASCESYVHTQAGLVSCFSFTGDAQDEISINNGTPTNVSLASDRFGYPNSAYQFSGSSSSYVSIANPSNFATNNYTYSGWIKATTLPSGTAWIFGIGQNGVGDQSLYLSNTNGSVSFVAHAYANPTYCLTALISGNSGVTVTQNQWYHITITMGPTAYRMYVNGKLVATSPSTCVSMIYGTPSAYIGSRLGYLSPFTGVIDDFRIYNRELSAEEVNNVMFTKGCRSACPENLSLVSAYINLFPLREEAAQIIATNTVTTTSKLRYDGTKSVLLQPGFKVEQGAVFEALNNGCGGDK